MGSDAHSDAHSAAELGQLGFVELSELCAARGVEAGAIAAATEGPRPKKALLDLLLALPARGEAGGGGGGGGRTAEGLPFPLLHI